MHYMEGCVIGRTAQLRKRKCISETRLLETWVTLATFYDLVFDNLSIACSRLGPCSPSHSGNYTPELQIFRSIRNTLF